MISTKNLRERDETRQCAIANANYRKVRSVLDGYPQADRYVVCRAKWCIRDITSLIALDYLPPHCYVDSGRRGEIGSPLVMVEGAVIEAMERVMEKPHHTNIVEPSKHVVPPVKTVPGQGFISLLLHGRFFNEINHKVYMG